MRIAGCLIVLLLPVQAWAGAWTQESGRSQLIVTGSNYSTQHFYDASGHKRSQSGYAKQELNPYFEYGLRDGLTAGANLSLDNARQNVPGGGTNTHWGIGDSEFFLRKRLWQQNAFVVSAEPMIKLPSPESSHASPKLGSSHPDAGIGLSAGYGFSAFGYHDFADLGTQYRYRFGTPENQIRLNGTLGIGVAPRWTLMPQAFLTFRTNSPTNPPFTLSSGDDYNLIKLQMSALYQLREDVALQAGAFGNVSGKNTGAGGGALFSVWKKF